MTPERIAELREMCRRYSLDIMYPTSYVHNYLEDALNEIEKLQAVLLKLRDNGRVSHLQNATFNYNEYNMSFQCIKDCPRCLLDKTLA